MSFPAVFESLDKGQAVEVIHILSRHLVEIRSRAALRNIIAVDSPADPKIEAAVMALVDEIERREGAKIEAISSEARVSYLNDLSMQLRSELDASVGGRDVSAALERLRRVS